MFVIICRSVQLIQVISNTSDNINVLLFVDLRFSHRKQLITISSKTVDNSFTEMMHWSLEVILKSSGHVSNLVNSFPSFSVILISLISHTRKLHTGANRTQPRCPDPWFQNTPLPWEIRFLARSSKWNWFHNSKTQNWHKTRIYSGFCWFRFHGFRSRNIIGFTKCMVEEKQWKNLEGVTILQP